LGVYTRDFYRAFSAGGWMSGLAQNPELATIFLLAQPQRREETYQQLVQYVQVGLNWQRFLRQVEVLRYAAWCGHQFAGYGLEKAIPADVLAYIRDQYVWNAYRGKVLLNAANAVTDTLKSAGLDVLWLKGIAAASLCYGDIRLRPMMDVDLLIREDQIHLAHDLLINAGWGYAGAPRDVWHYRSYQIHTYNHAYQRVVPVDSGMERVWVELHWRPASQRLVPQLPPDAFWDAVGVAKDTQHMETLSPENFLIHLCIHQAKSNFRAHLSRLDLALLVDQYVMDWDQVARKAEKWGLQRMVTAALTDVQVVFGSKIPPIDQSARLSLGVRYLQQQGRKATYTLLDRFDITPYQLLFLERWSDRFRFLGSVLFYPNSHDLKRWALSPSTQILYMIIKPVRLCVTLFVRIFSFVFR